MGKGERWRTAFLTLGCKVNQFDTEGLAAQFWKKGFLVVPSDEPADIYVINTCTVTKSAEQKARQLIRKIRKEHPRALLVVTGCYAQTNPEAIRELPGVRVVTGVAGRENLVELVEKYLASQNPLWRVLPWDREQREDFPLLQPEFKGRTRAFLKIQDGCGSFCSYCKIPLARGPLRSLPPATVLAEFRRFLALGFKEVVLVGIHLGAYGRHLDFDLAGLIRRIDREKGDFRVRLGSVEPLDFTPELIAAFSQAESFCPHLHIPLQSGSAAVLSRMNRPYTPKEYARIVEELRRNRPGLAVSTDVMVGFPGETEEEFGETLNFLRDQEFSRVHIFPFSPREGTPAAGMPGQIPRRVKEERKQRAMEVARKAAAGYRQKLDGKVVEVLTEKESAPGVWEGFCGEYLRVQIKGRFSVNSFVKARIAGAEKEPLPAVPVTADP